MSRYRIVYKSSNIEVTGPEFLIGRSTDCNLVLDDPSVSRVHAALVLDGDTLFVEDRGSRNGLSVNGKQASDRLEVFDGDAIVIGHQTLRVVSLDRPEDSDRTMGLRQCGKCGAWLSADAQRCPSCRATTSEIPPEVGPPRSRETRPSVSKSKSDSVIDYKPVVMMTGLIEKAIQVNKLPDAERLLDNVMEIAMRRLEGASSLSDEEFDAVAGTIVHLTRATAKPDHISQLFRLHRVAERLMSRELVEQLYQLVIDVRYRSCPEMNAYLEMMAGREGSFSPGERFVNRRLQGLKSIAS